MNIIITGGSKGIGYELAKRFSESAENRILVIARSKNLLKKLSEDSEHNNISFISSDLNNSLKSPEILLKQVSEQFKHIDILVNNAGLLISKAFSELSIEETMSMTYTNFLSPLILTRQLLPLFIKGSHIINISSMGGFQGSSRYSGLSVYSATKAALSNLTESLAAEYADTGISFNCLAFGAVQTEMLHTAFPGYKAPITAENMSEFVEWFAYNGNKYFNGKILPVSVSNP